MACTLPDDGIQQATQDKIDDMGAATDIWYRFLRRAVELNQPLEVTAPWRTAAVGAGVAVLWIGERAGLHGQVGGGSARDRAGCDRVRV